MGVTDEGMFVPRYLEIYRYQRLSAFSVTRATPGMGCIFRLKRLGGTRCRCGHVTPADPSKAVASRPRRRARRAEATDCGAAGGECPAKGPAPPVIKSSGMEDATTPKRRGQPGRRRDKMIPRVAVETQVLRMAVPSGSQFKGLRAVPGAGAGDPRAGGALDPEHGN
jgi:hypothetical protein